MLSRKIRIVFPRFPQDVVVGLRIRSRGGRRRGIWGGMRERQRGLQAMSRAWRSVWATRIGSIPSGAIARGCCCPARASQSSRWRPGCARIARRRSIRPCCTSWASRLVGQSPLGRRRPAERGARGGAAGDDGGRSGARLDRRRHRVSQEGHPFGGRGPAGLRPTGQAGELSGGGVAVGGRRGGLAADRPAALPAQGVERRPAAARQGQGARRGRLSHQAPDRPGADHRGTGRGRARRGGAGRRGAGPPGRCPPRPGKPWPGATARTARSRGASPRCACARPRATIAGPPRGRRTGC